MALLRKRLPVDPAWAKGAVCKYDDPDKWDLDVKGWRKGRATCILDCPVREACLRKALQQDGGTIGVVRGGIEFNVEQQRKKRSTCPLCTYPVAALKVDANGKMIPSLCWVCRRYAPCLNQCGRMVTRKPGLDAYYCPYCSK